MNYIFYRFVVSIFLVISIVRWESITWAIPAGARSTPSTLFRQCCEDHAAQRQPLPPH